jgi:hypothetical protein
MAKPRKSKDENERETLAKKPLSVPGKPLEESKIEKPKKPKKRLRRPVDSEANT